MVVGDSRAACNKGMSTGPMVTAVPAWLMMGMLTRKPIRTVPGIRNRRSERTGPINRLNQVLIAAGLTQDIGKAHGGADGDARTARG